MFRPPPIPGSPVAKDRRSLRWIAAARPAIVVEENLLRVLRSGLPVALRFELLRSLDSLPKRDGGNPVLSALQRVAGYGRIGGGLRDDGWWSKRHQNPPKTPCSIRWCARRVIKNPGNQKGGVAGGPLGRAECAVSALIVAPSNHRRPMTPRGAGRRVPGALAPMQVEEGRPWHGCFCWRRGRAVVGRRVSP